MREASAALVTRRPIRAAFLGRVEYSDGLRLQREAAARVAAGGCDELLLLEHPPVLTLGRNAATSEIVASSDAIAARGATIERTDRGGKATFHGPGQLVGYPVIDLRPDRQDVGRYVADLEATIIRTLADYGVAAGRFPGFTGVWVDGARPDVLPPALAGDGRRRKREGSASEADPPASSRKIAAIGVHLAHWVTTHGFALNVATDLSFYDLIVPCGIEGWGVTSLQKLIGRTPPLSEVAERLIGHFAAIFDREPLA